MIPTVWIKTASGAKPLNGRGAGVRYAFNATTSSGDPTTGLFRLNHATPASATALYISATDKDACALGPTFLSWDDSTNPVKGVVTIRHERYPDVFADYNVTAATDHTTWVELTLTYVNGNGSFTAGRDAYVTFFRAGNVGDQGIQGDPGDDGDDGAPGADGDDGISLGYRYAYSTSTTEADPTAGIFALDHTTFSSVSELYISGTDAFANNLDAVLATWDDSTSTVRGTLHIVKEAAPDDFIELQVTGTRDTHSAAGWSTFAVTYVAHAGTFSAADVCRIFFIRTGDLGTPGIGGGDPGPPGDDGEDGKTVLNGSGAPGGGVGVDGDFYIDTVVWQIYGPKTSGAWGSGTDLLGDDGRDAGIKYVFDSTTSSGDPGTGEVRFNNSAVASVTSLFISETDGDGGGIAAFLATLDDSTTSASRGHLIFRKDGTPGNFAIFAVNSVLTDNGSWDTVPVTYLASAGAGFTNGDVLKMTFSRTGDKGDQGNPGTDGDDGDPGAPGDDGTDGRDAGLNYNYSTSTGVANPGSGFFRLSSTTFSSATFLMISETDADATDVSGYLATWDDSTSTVKGYVVLRKRGTPASFAIFAVAGLLDQGVYDVFSVTHIASNGTWSNSDPFSVEFYATGDAGATGGTGGAGTNGTNGTDGRDAGIKLTYSTTTSSGDPGSGKFRLNNATLASATSLYISETDGDSASIAAAIASWDDSTSTGNRGTVTFRKRGTPSTYAQYSITSGISDNGAWDTYTIAHISSNGSWSDNDVFNVEFSRTGDKGDTGSTGLGGSDGLPGTDGTDGRDAGIKYVFDSSTSSGDPGSGEVRFNHGTISSVTSLFLSETDGDSVSLAGYIATFDDSTTSAIRGHITFRKDGSPGNFVVFAVNSAITDNGSWDTIPVAWVSSGGAGFSNGDVLKMSFVRSGDKGDQGIQGDPGSPGDDAVLPAGFLIAVNVTDDGGDGDATPFTYTFSAIGGGTLGTGATPEWVYEPNVKVTAATHGTARWTGSAYVLYQVDEVPDDATCS